MKKITALFLAACMVFTFAACAGNNAGTSANQSDSEAPVSTEANAPDGSTASESRQSGESTKPAANDSGDIAQSGSSEPAEETNGDDTQNNSSDLEEADSSNAAKVLVAYFSATGTTRGVAQTVADSVGADLYEITPEQPYTDADLDYHDDNSRSTIEMNDPSVRPAISGTVENMAQYDIIFIGYPIWWGDAPRILSTFVEGYDLSGKTIVPFCTSGGSGIGSSARNLEALTSGATWLSGIRLSGGADRSTIAEWINGLELGITAQ